MNLSILVRGPAVAKYACCSGVMGSTSVGFVSVLGKEGGGGGGGVFCLNGSGGETFLVGVLTGEDWDAIIFLKNVY